MTPLEPELVVEVGAEGGSLALFRETTEAGEVAYFAVLNVMSFEDIPAINQRGEPVGTFEEAIALLDAEPDWPRLYVVQVHPAYAARVLEAVEERLARLGDSHSIERALARWRERCSPRAP